MVRPLGARRLPAGLGYLAPLALLVGVSGVLPIFSSISHALFAVTAEGTSFRGFASFSRLTRDQALLYSLNISTLYSLAATALRVLWAIPVASFLHRRRRFLAPGMVVLAILWIVPVFIAAPVWRMFFHGNNGESLFRALTGLSTNLLLDGPASFLVVLFTSALHGLPPVVLVIYAGLRRTPTELVDAARVDGATDLQVLRHVHGPGLSTYLFLLVVVTLIDSFREFTLPYLMTAGGPPLVEGITAEYVVGATTTLEIYLYDLFSFSGDLALPAAYATVFLLLFFLVALVWYLVRRGRRRVAVLSAAAAVLLVAFDGGFFQPSAPALVIAGLLAVTAALVILRPDVHPLLQAAPAVAAVLLIVLETATEGILSGFQPALLPALGVPLVLRRHREAGTRVARFGVRVTDVLWRPIRLVAVVVPTLSAIIFLYLLVWISFSQVDAIFIDSLFPAFAGTGNYAALLGTDFLRSLANSLILSGTTATVAVSVAFLAAGGAVVHRLRGGRVFLAMQFLGLSGGIHALIPLFALVITLGLVNSYLPIVILYAAAALPVGFYVVYGYLNALPASLFDAARLAGAGTGRYLWRILLPMSRPALVNVFLLAWIVAWNGFLIPLMFLTEPQTAPLSVYLHSLVGTLASGTSRWGVFAAGAVVNIVLLALLFVAGRRPLQYSAAAEVREL